MNKRTLVALSLAAFSLMVSKSAFSQSTNEVNVPFAFTVGSVDLPAGDYLIKQTSDSNFVRISDLKTGKVIFVNAPERVSLPLGAPAKVVFRQHGDQHFLASIWGGAGGTARVFSATNTENVVIAQQRVAAKGEMMAQK